MPTAAYTAQRDAFGRSVQYLVEIDLDRCSLTYTSAPCTAVDLGDGLRCFYTYQTCQDATNFTKTTRTYRFCLNEVPWPDPATAVYPLLKQFVAIPQKIDPARLHTDPEKIVADFALDYAPPPQDHDKGSGKHNTQRNGEFWRLLLARNRNYPGRALRVKRGFNASGFVLSDFSQVGPTFRLKAWDISRDGATLTAESPLAKLGERQVPVGIGQDNTLQSAVTDVATTWTVRDATEYPDPADYSRNSIFAECESEIVEITSINTGTNELTVTRAQWGTTAVAHDAGKKVSHVLCVGTNNGASAPTGRKVAEVLQDMLEWAGVAAADVDTSSFDKVSQLWPDADVEATVRKSKTVAQHCMTLREPRGIVLFIAASSGKFAAQVMAPDLAMVTHDEDTIVRDSLEVSEDDEARLTRAALWYNPVDESAQNSSSTVQYQNAVLVVNTDLESTNNYNDVREEALLDFWVDAATSTSRLRNFARRLINRRRAGVRVISFSLEIKNATLEVGDGVSITTSQILTPRGANDTRPCIVTAKRERSESVIDYEAADLAFGGRYLRIGPDTTTDDYDTATEAERNTYGFWGDSNNRVGDIKEPGYLFW